MDSRMVELRRRAERVVGLGWQVCSSSQVFAAGLVILAFAASACSSDTKAPQANPPRPVGAEAGIPSVNPRGLPAICSGCATDAPDSTDTTVHFHHVHLNTENRQTTVDFYEKYFGSREVRLNGKVDELEITPKLMLMDEVPAAPNDSLQVGLEHIGWGSNDPDAWYQHASSLGVPVDARPGAPAQVVAVPVPEYSNIRLIYLEGPSSERIEVFTDPVEAYNHVHFMTQDLDKTVGFYTKYLGVEPEHTPDVSVSFFTSNNIRIDGVNLIFFGAPYPYLPTTFEPTDDRAVSHIAFSVTNLQARFAAMTADGVEIVSEPKLTEFGFKSFFVRAPDNVLLEFVESSPYAPAPP
jgi:catechol 2,3-dioxygenase-like lactoylglutathione lyase family enzyme